MCNCYQYAVLIIFVLQVPLFLHYNFLIFIHRHCDHHLKDMLLVTWKIGWPALYVCTLPPPPPPSPVNSNSSFDYTWNTMSPENLQLFFYMALCFVFSAAAFVSMSYWRNTTCISWYRFLRGRRQLLLCDDDNQQSSHMDSSDVF